ncbi:4-hydroxy-tetrahydrodipicolinate synthase [Propionispira arboris]|uniref:4-hydroxy-tetrahydrodipicolinate synthase n=1 Tax=Propionispira arboris TaxID=84035 RepID=A0A1H7C3A7_9FIRM|nr:4-hydroxy-tetrahydrodipicolinate synthase [Propionispira arboris]SEJ84171.1 4-hydroxy-tetrahydrodipicolinate synthase [Propionispira arboris]
MIEGVWLPIITPFLNDHVDFPALKKMVEHYIDKGIYGFMPLATTGEIPTIDELEYEEIIAQIVEYVNGRVPIFVGCGGNDTRRLVKQLKIVEKYKVNGILSVCPFYNRPSQEGIYEHFRKISEATDLDIVLYNIPYRTGINMENETIYRLAELKNIIGLKDSCGDTKQSMQLLLNRPENFSVLTGEDCFFYNSLALGGNGGIMASAHIETEKFIALYAAMKNNDHHAAMKKWHDVVDLISLLFTESNPMPIKYVLYRAGLIHSDEARLPLIPISAQLKKKLDQVVGR